MQASWTGRRKPGPSLTSTPPKSTAPRSSLRRGKIYCSAQELFKPQGSGSLLCHYTAQQTQPGWGVASAHESHHGSGAGPLRWLVWTPPQWSVHGVCVGFRLCDHQLLRERRQVCKAEIFPIISSAPQPDCQRWQVKTGLHAGHCGQLKVLKNGINHLEMLVCYTKCLKFIEALTGSCEMYIVHSGWAGSIV